MSSKLDRPSRRMLLTETEAAEVLSISVRALQTWRVKGGGPTFIKIGRSVRYRQADLESFIGAGERRNTSGSSR